MLSVRALHEKLGELIIGGYGDKEVKVAKTTFTHPLESDGCTILDVGDVHMTHHHIIDDEGGIKETPDGTDIMTVSAVLYGDQ